MHHNCLGFAALFASVALANQLQQLNKSSSLLKYPEPLQHHPLLLPALVGFFFLLFLIIIYFIKTPAINIPLELKVAQLGAKAQLKHRVFLQDSAFMVCRTIEMYSTNPWVGGDACRNESSESLCRGSQVFHLSPSNWFGIFSLHLPLHWNAPTSYQLTMGSTSVSLSKSS